MDPETGDVTGDLLGKQETVVTAKPLNRNFVKIPLVGEMVVVHWLPIGGTEQMLSQPHGWFWATSFDISSSQFQNTDRSHPNYVGGRKEYAKTFDLRLDAPEKVPHEEGEVSVLGRFGSALRQRKEELNLYSKHGSITFTNQSQVNFRVPSGVSQTNARIDQITFVSDRLVFKSNDILINGKLILSTPKWKTDIDTVIDILQDLVTEISNLTSGISQFTVATPAGPGNTTISTNSANLLRLKTKLATLK